jgi:anti-anti-sigma factor
MHDDSFRCTLQQLDGSVVCLVLSGELDLASVDTFRPNLNTAALGAYGILLDFHDLRYIDSSGINALLNAHQAFAPSGRRIALVGVSPNVRRILSVLHLEDLMPAFPSVDEALVYLRSHGESGRPLTGA